MADYRLRILHLSDLHERVALPWMEDSRKKQIELGEGSRGRVLEDRFFQVLAEVRPIDIVCFTGDVADWGLSDEYLQAEKLIRRILEVVQVPVERFFLVPGNHDINRKVEKVAWSEMRPFVPECPDEVSRWMGGLNPPRGANPEWRDAILKRTQEFWDWVIKSLGRSCLYPSQSPHQRLGYRQQLDVAFPFPVYIIGLDSAWLCGDNNDPQKIHLTKHQLDMLTRSGKDCLNGFRLALVHHPLTDLADRHQSQRILTDTVDLLLHGHQHQPTVALEKSPYVIAAGCLYEGDQEDKWPNAFNVINVHLNKDGRPLQYDVEFWGWSVEGHWFPNGALYSEAKDGRLTWQTLLGRSISSSTQRITTTSDINITTTEALPSSGDAAHIATEASQRRVEPEELLIEMLVGKIKDLMKVYCYKEAEPFTGELEKQLKGMQQKGVVVRKAWITLMQHSLSVARMLPSPVNEERLRYLNERIENVNVID